MGVNELQIEVHCIHPHDAPLYDTQAEILAEMVPSTPHTTDLAFIAVASERVASAAHEALKNLQPLTHVACGKGKVEKVASNRRVPLPNGKIGVRFSSCRDPELIAAPEGLIDPWMRTITLFNQQHPIARLHYYATHPQSYYGQGHMNPDFPGIARERLDKEEGIPQIYFTGCAGNVAAGKYNDGSHEMRGVLANLMRNALTHTPPGSPIELSVSDTDGGVRVAVRDHGPGLPDGAEASVFERFWRSEGGRGRGRAGAGLGLAIVAAIVDAHGGRVSARNAPGGGASFAIDLPAEQRDDAEQFDDVAPAADCSSDPSRDDLRRA